MVVNGRIQAPRERQPEQVGIVIGDFWKPVGHSSGAPSNRRFCLPPPSNWARTFWSRMRTPGRTRWCWHRWSLEDGHVGRAWQAPGANFDQIQGLTSPTSISWCRIIISFLGRGGFQNDDGLQKLSHTYTKCLTLCLWFEMVYKHRLESSLSTLKMLFAMISRSGGAWRRENDHWARPLYVQGTKFQS